MLTGRDINDFSLTMREMAVLPWRKLSSDAQGRPTQYRANGAVAGLPMTVVLDITYYADAHATYPGLLQDKTYTVSGPDQNSTANNRTIKISPIYDNASLEKTGQDVEVDGVSINYTP